MNPKILKYYIALQPKFWEAMGNFINGDPYGCECGYFGIAGRDVHIDCEKWNKRLLRLPLPIDTRNPKRGLWGMIKWNRDVWIASDGNIAIEGITVGCESPELALLKTLAHQWKVEVEK